jgi:hypothetical protein
VFLPPYAPDRNPDELALEHLKVDTVGRMAMTSEVDFTKTQRDLCCRRGSTADFARRQDQFQRLEPWGLVFSA